MRRPVVPLSSLMTTAAKAPPKPVSAERERLRFDVLRDVVSPPS